MDEELRARHNLPVEWYDVLVQLLEAGGQRTMGNLASVLLISPSNCSRLVDRMSTEGLIRREADVDDGRVKHAVLTDTGFAVLKEASPTHLGGIQRYFAGFLGDDESVVVGMFSQMLRALGCDTQLDGARTAADPGRGGGT